MNTPATCQLKERPKYVLPPPVKEPLADRCLRVTIWAVCIAAVIFLAGLFGIGAWTIFSGMVAK